MANRILLTGAGFSHNFGAPLASEMSNIIFNDPTVQKQNNLRELLLNNFDYESVYQQVTQGDDYSQEEKKALISAVNATYKKVDERIIRNGDLSQTYGDLFTELLFKFSRRYGGSGFIFTLNQDLLIERRFESYPNANISSLELPIMGSSVFQKTWNESLSNENRRVVPNDDTFKKEKQKFEKKQAKDKIELAYIKLHGSQEWYKDDENNMMVIGHGKSKKIATEPLLTWYFEIFEEQLKQKETRLLIIGYGFNDEHINKAIAEAGNDLKIYVINTTPMKDFTLQLKEKEQGENIISKINRYYPRSLRELFPNDPNHPTPPEREELTQNFFND